MRILPTIVGRSSPHSHASLKTAIPYGPNSEDNRYLALARYWQQYTNTDAAKYLMESPMITVSLRIVTRIDKQEGHLYYPATTKKGRVAIPLEEVLRCGKATLNMWQ